MKKWAIVLVGFFLLASLSACAVEEGFAVKVNGTPIPMGNYEDKIEAVKGYFEEQGVDLSTPEAEATLKNIEYQVLESLISSELIHQEVVANNWDINAPEIIEQVENLKAQIPDGDYEKWLEEQDMTENEILEYFAFTHFVSEDVTVTEQEVKDFFEANLSSYGGQEEQVKASHILLETEEEALEVIEQLKAGADFVELAKEKSIEPNADVTGGDLGYFTRNQMLPEFEEAAFNQEVGTFSEEPVKTEYGYHVIFVEDHKEQVIPDFDEVKDKVEEDALFYAKNQKVISYYSELRENAEIEYAEALDPEKN